MMPVIKKIFALLILIAIIMLQCTFAFAIPRTVRIGFYYVSGYQEINDAGIKSGYGYEYLQNMLMYSDWTYDYIGYGLSWAEIKAMLSRGDIDLCITATKTDEREEVFDYSDLPVSTSFTTLLIRSSDSAKYSTGNFSQYNNLRIGFIRSGSQAKSFYDFSCSNCFAYNPVYFDTPAELETAFLDGSIDAAVTSNMRKLKSSYIVEQFDPQPVYAIVQKGNTELLDEVNFALIQLARNDPTLSNTLYRKYYYTNSDTRLPFTLQEQAYIDRCNNDGTVFSVLIKPDSKPYSYFENGIPNGIIVDLADYVADKTGLRFSFIQTTSLNDYHNKLCSGDYDICFDFVSDYNLSEKYNCRLTTTFYQTSYSKLMQKKYIGDSSCVAVTSTDFSEQYIENKISESNVKYYDSTAECIDAVIRGECAYAALPSLTAQEAAYSTETNQLLYVALPSYTAKYAAAVPYDKNALLTSILNKAINGIDEELISNSENSYAQHFTPNFSLISYIYNDPMAVFIVVVSIFALIIGIVLFILRRRNRILERKRTYEFERFIGFICSANDEVCEIDLKANSVIHYTYSGGHVNKTVDNIDAKEYIFGRIHPDDKARAKNAWADERIASLIENGGHSYFECRFKQNDGTYHWVSCLLMELEHDENHPRNYMITVRDIDDEKLAAEAQNRTLADALHSARQANIAKSQFLSRMSHEIRTPLNAVIGYNVLMRDLLSRESCSTVLEEKLTDYLSKGDEASSHLLSIINDVLDISSIESGKMRITDAPFDFAAFILSITSMFFGQTKTKNINFNVIIHDITKEKIIGDKLRLSQILINIIGNAVKFTPSGGQITLTITQSATREKNVYFRFEIKDTGIGMSSKMVAKIFDPFEQGDPSIPHNYGGTGLGLSITKNLVDMMRGEIAVKSAKDKGSTFTVDLPFVIDSSSENDNAPDSDITNLSMLIVDDSASCDYLMGVFKHRGAKCDAVFNGANALNAAKARKQTDSSYNLCIINWELCDMRCMELISTIRRLFGSQPPAIIVTAYDISQIQDEAESVGIYLFLQKPIFCSAVNKLLSQLYSDNMSSDTADKKENSIENFANARVLLVEDNKMNMEIAQRILQHFGFIVETAVNGYDALEKFSDSTPYYYNVILMDIQMPVMDGYNATRAIRSCVRCDAHSIPIIAMTANAFAEDVAKSLSCGMNAHIAKPINPQIMVRTINEFLKK